MTDTDRDEQSQLRRHGFARRRRRANRTTVLPASGAIPGMARVLRNVERRAASRRLCI